MLTITCILWLCRRNNELDHHVFDFDYLLYAQKQLTGARIGSLLDYHLLLQLYYYGSTILTKSNVSWFQIPAKLMDSTCINTV